MAKSADTIATVFDRRAEAARSVIRKRMRRFLSLVDFVPVKSVAVSDVCNRLDEMSDEEVDAVLKHIIDHERESVLTRLMNEGMEALREHLEDAEVPFTVAELWVKSLGDKGRFESELARIKRKPSNRERDAEIVRLIDEEGLKPSVIAKESLRRLNEIMKADAVRQAYNREKIRQKEDAKKKKK